MDNDKEKSSKFSSEGEDILYVLRVSENKESKKAALINELKKGEKSGFIDNFNRESFLKNMHKKHVAEK